MAINPDALFAHDFAAPTQSYGPRDAILYALGLGLGHDPVDQADLAFLNETRLRVLPTFAVTLTTPGMWIRDSRFGVDFGKLVHFEQMAWFPNPLPPSADVTGEARVISLTDRGEGKGAVLVLERTIRDAASGATCCTLRQTLLLRSDGGFGGPPAPRTPSVIPHREADAWTDVSTSPRSALIYRLSGDWNPLHIAPETARRAGFDKPILHGLASYGMAGLAVSRALGQDPAAITELGCRFSGIVTPGETLTFHVWKTETGASFRAFSETRKLLDEGRIAWRKS